MKTKLTKEQSQHLIDLGVPKEKASLILPTDSYEIEDIEITTGDPIFKLEDFLNGKILPKDINDEENNLLYELKMDYSSISEKWYARYEDISEEDCISENAENLIDALYKLACSYCKKYLKTKQS